MAKIPEKIGKYKVLSLVGKGGMGLVYAAEHPTLKRKVILKKLTIKDKEFRERFRLEADLMMDLRSDYIVDMYDHFREGSSYYIVMEFIEGISLEELIKKNGPVDYTLFVYIMSCTIKAIEYIHKRGIIHRDIKPSNIYLSRTGEVKLGDFGIAFSETRNVKITDSGSAMGTPAYMAPEQFLDSSTVDKRADIFSLGVTIYESLTGIKPFRSENYTELKQEISRGKYKGVTTVKKNLPLYLRWFIFRSLLVHPFLRFQNLQSISRRLQREMRKVSYVKIKEQLATLAAGDKKKVKGSLTEVVHKKGGKISSPFRKYIIPSTMILILFLFLGFGGFYRFIAPVFYGGLNLKMVPASEDSRFTLFHENLHEIKKIKTGSFNNKGSATVFLKEGSYRVKIESGSHVSWRSFYISSFSDTSGEKMEMTVLSSQLEPLPLELNYTVRDRFSGKIIPEGITIEILNTEKWIILDKTTLDGLTSGNLYQLRFTASGYSPGYYTLENAYYQTSLNIDVLLTPLAAELTIPAIDGDIRINGKKEYFSLDTLRFEKLDLVHGKSSTLKLLPGKYNFTVIIDDLSGEETFEIYSNEHFEITEIKIEGNRIKIELEKNKV
ncbi:MAG: serine/threonine-protein kinase [Spirochaetaceae bacterium]|nr:serine/threonine-protein kinase [Spirochaetaceae bacterium]